MSVLQISFDGINYVVSENFDLELPIDLYFTRNQNPFTITFFQWTIDQVEDEGLGYVIYSSEIDRNSRAALGISQ